MDKEKFNSNEETERIEVIRSGEAVSDDMLEEIEGGGNGGGGNCTFTICEINYGLEETSGENAPNF